MTKPRAVILVEGVSDQLALEALAARRGRDLAARGVTVVAMDGVTNLRGFLERFGPRGSDLTVAGLYDAPAEPEVRRALERAGLGSVASRLDFERLGFFACIDDLEEELIRAVGAEGVLDIVERNGELERFRIMQKQPEWRGRRLEDQLKRFLGNASRKIRYASTMIGALDLSKVPGPLDAVLAHVRANDGAGPRD